MVAVRDQRGLQSTMVLIVGQRRPLVKALGTVGLVADARQSYWKT
jgi:hypothetical protein